MFSKIHLKLAKKNFFKTPQKKTKSRKENKKNQHDILLTLVLRTSYASYRLKSSAKRKLYEERKKKKTKILKRKFFYNIKKKKLKKCHKMENQNKCLKSLVSNVPTILGLHLIQKNYF